MESVLPSAVGLDKAKSCVERDVLDHGHIGVEAKLAKAPAALLGECILDERTAKTATSGTGGDRHVVEQQIVDSGDEDDQSTNRVPFFQHGDLTLADASGVVVVDRCREFAEARKVERIGVADEGVEVGTSLARADRIT